MGWGILEPRQKGHVPGTTRYYDDPNQPGYIANQNNGRLKTVMKNGDHLILIPQPSDDPNDPLNWPLWKRDLITFILSMSAIFATAQGSILAANTIVITIEIKRKFTEVALLTGYFLMGCGAAAVFFVPSGRVWGKRHAFIVGLVILVASSAWASTVGSNYESFVWARIIQGVGCAPFETLVNAAVGDLYFVHERGIRMAFTNLAVFGGAFFTPIVVGKMTMTMGWKWTFIFSAIFCAACFPLVFFWCPETAYRRNSRLNTDMACDTDDTQSTGIPGTRDSQGNAFEMSPRSDSNSIGETGQFLPSSKEDGHRTEPHVEQSGFIRKKTFRESLALFDGRKTDDNYLVLLLRPFPLLFHPAFLWTCLIQGTMIGWTVFIGVIIAMIFQGPPYWWQEDKAGYTYLGPFLGAVLGFFIAAFLSDWMVRYMTKRNNGIYEPEFRILLIIPMFIVGEIGLFGFGITASQIITGESVWQEPVVFFGLEVCAMVIGTVSSSLYIVDAYRDLAIEGFTISIIFKNLFSFFLTWYAFDWVTMGIGTKKTMFILASVQIFVCLTSIPMYIYGKRIRAYFHHHDMLKKLRLK
ncbi:hypothetical protein Cpir12675_005795 [Ceratocystis pirilliformis]|uniref:Protein HOL1 n=1 Tax=Ceratocystis pirilliformis TaxID=259994 RepID=A0ABR3YNF7_9PEZI